MPTTLSRSVDMISHSSLHTERLGERLASRLRANDVITLRGELGTGKTVLARGIAIGLGVDATEVTSPTFVIVHEHRSGRLPLFHVDLYRLERSGLGTTGWEEFLRSDGVTVIEWPERAGDLLPEDRLEVSLEHVADTKRKVVLAGTGQRSRQIVEELRDDVVGA